MIMNRFSIIFLTVSNLLFLSIRSDAFDGNRKGFIIGGGLGLGSVSFSIAEKPFLDHLPSQSQNSFVGSFKIGYAVNDNLEIYIGDKESLVTDILPSRAGLYVYGLLSVGASYYFRTAIPAPYLSAGIGKSYLLAPLNKDLESWFGNGLYVGSGLEIGKHVGVEFDLVYSRPESGRYIFEGLVPSLLFVITGY